MLQWNQSHIGQISDQEECTVCIINHRNIHWNIFYEIAVLNNRQNPSACQEIKFLEILRPGNLQLCCKQALPKILIRVLVISYKFWKYLRTHLCCRIFFMAAYEVKTKTKWQAFIKGKCQIQESSDGVVIMFFYRFTF